MDVARCASRKYSVRIVGCAARASCGLTLRAPLPYFRGLCSPGFADHESIRRCVNACTARCRRWPRRRRRARTRRPIPRGRSSSSCRIRRARSPTSSRARSASASAPRSKQPVVIENKPGAGTLVGAESVAKQPPDGYTLLMATSTTLGISPALYRPSPINPVKDFAPVSPVGTVNFFLIANPSFPAKNVAEMIDAIKREPGQVQLRLGGQRQPASSLHGGAEDASTASRSSTFRTRARRRR